MGKTTWALGDRTLAGSMAWPARVMGGMNLASLWPLVKMEMSWSASAKTGSSGRGKDVRWMGSTSLRQAHRRPALLLGGPAACPVVLDTETTPEAHATHCVRNGTLDHNGRRPRRRHCGPGGSSYQNPFEAAGLRLHPL